MNLIRTGIFFNFVSVDGLMIPTYGSKSAETKLFLDCHICYLQIGNNSVLCTVLHQAGNFQSYNP